MPWCVMACRPSISLYGGVNVVLTGLRSRQTVRVHALEGPHWEAILLSAIVNFNLQSLITLSGPVGQRDIQSRKNLVSPVIFCDTVKFQVLERVIVVAVFMSCPTMLTSTSLSFFTAFFIAFCGALMEVLMVICRYVTTELYV